MIDVLVSTVDASRTPGGLEYIKGQFRLLVDDRKGWAEASNALFDQAKYDALFLDDDVTLTETTLSLLPQYYDRADVFGFSLLAPLDQGWGMASAGYSCGVTGTPIAARDVREILEPAYVAHVTASAMYVKKHVIDAGIRFPVWPGAHFEDVAFTYDCWLHGFKVAYIPGFAIHPIENGGGQTKAAEEAFHLRRLDNYRHFEQWCLEHDVYEAIAQGRIPSKRMPICK